MSVINRQSTVWAQFMNSRENQDLRGSISRDDYAAWQKTMTFDLLKGNHIGKSFCEHFGVTDYILDNAYYSENYHTRVIDYIENYYVQKG